MGQPDMDPAAPMPATAAPAPPASVPPVAPGQLAREAEGLAAMASRLLAEALASGGDAKRAKDLSGIFKDMAVLARDLGGADAPSLTVRFEGDAGAAAD